MSKRLIKSAVNSVILASILILSSLTTQAITIPSQPSGYVNDYANMLTAQQIQTLNNRLQEFEQKTTNQVVVATFNTLDGQALDSFSIKLATQWQIGQKGKDNGVILLIIKNDHKIRIEVGYGLEGVLTDAQSGIIIRQQIAPSFKKAEYYQGIQNGVNAILHTISPEKFTQSSTPVVHSAHSDLESAKNTFLGALGFLIFLYIIISVIGNLILSFIHLFEKKKVHKSNRWFGPCGFFRITLFNLFLFLFLNRSLSGNSSGGGGFSGGGGGFGGGGASGSW